MIKQKLFWIILLLVFGCRKQLSITDFTGDYNFYQPEIRIEALMLPTENTAIIRVDRSARLDEGLNEEGYYNCKDDDGDWGFHYCTEVDSAYDNSSHCSVECASECILHLYFCDSDSTTFVSQDACTSHCTEGDCKTDDVGEDGVPAYDSNNDGDYKDVGLQGDIPPDKGEGNGLPDCNEPNVDEFDEILPGIHITNCNVTIMYEGDSCHFVHKENGGIFYEENRKKSHSIFDAEQVSYGAWVPDSTNCPIRFDNYDSAYHLSVDCSNESGFENTGKITAVDIPKRPVVFYHQSMEDSLIQCKDVGDNQSIFNCMDGFNFSDTTYFELGTVDYDSVNCALLNFAVGMMEEEAMDSLNCEELDTETKQGIVLEFIAMIQNSSIEELIIPKIRYAALFETDWFQAVQYVQNPITDEWIYIHGHPAA
ncbi:MAG: hypothetical protein QGF57_03540, partial [Candidatus Marinimicrobia bacterium]|nr:hypothetical protein [Candidatus Neomarinimicrobiota bacterium]